MTTLVYVYAVLDAGRDEPRRGGIERLRGIEGATVRLIRHGSLTAAVSDVAADEFDEEPLNARLSDLAWLGPRAMAHQHVNAQLFEEVRGLLPLSFGTVFRADDGVRQFLAGERQELTRRLESIRGRAEWVVAIRRDQDAARAHIDASVAEVRKLLDDAAAATPGRAYLLQRRLEDVRHGAAIALDREIVGVLMDTLEHHAEDVYREPLPEDASDAPIARASVLVSRDDEQAFVRAVERLNRDWASRGYSIEITGPWPPYRFSGLSAEVAHARR